MSHISRSSGELISADSFSTYALSRLYWQLGHRWAAFHPAFLAGADVLVDALVPADQGDFAGGEDVVVEVVGFVLFFDGECHGFLFHYLYVDILSITDILVVR